MYRWQIRIDLVRFTNPLVLFIGNPNLQCKRRPVAPFFFNLDQFVLGPLHCCRWSFMWWFLGNIWQLHHKAWIESTTRSNLLQIDTFGCQIIISWQYFHGYSCRKWDGLSGLSYEKCQTEFCCYAAGLGCSLLLQSLVFLFSGCDTATDSRRLFLKTRSGCACRPSRCDTFLKGAALTFLRRRDHLLDRSIS